VVRYGIAFLTFLAFVGSTPVALAADYVETAKARLEKDLKKTHLKIGLLEKSEERKIGSMRSQLNISRQYGNAGGSLKTGFGLPLKVDANALSSSRELLDAMAIMFREQEIEDPQDKEGSYHRTVKLDEYDADREAFHVWISTSYFNKKLKDGGAAFLKDKDKKEKIENNLREYFLETLAYLALIPGMTLE